MINKKNIFYFFFVIIIFVIDRASKIIVINLVNDNSKSEIIILDFLSISLVWNEGIAFGFLSLEEKIFYNILTIIIILVIFLVFLMMLKSNGWEKIGFIMVFSGALGNAFDRIVFSAVPDFIDFHINNFHWFTFNFADVFITLGVFLLIINEVKLIKKK